QRAVAARGGNGFMTVAAAQAALLLAQGTGRLLRTVDDRGVIAILDPRMATARYSGFLRASLPPYWTTYDPQIVRSALGRLAADSPAPSRRLAGAPRATRVEVGEYDGLAIDRDESQLGQRGEIHGDLGAPRFVVAAEDRRASWPVLAVAGNQLDVEGL